MLSIYQKRQAYSSVRFHHNRNGNFSTMCTADLHSRRLPAAIDADHSKYVDANNHRPDPIILFRWFNHATQWTSFFLLKCLCVHFVFCYLWSERVGGQWDPSNQTHKKSSKKKRINKSIKPTTLKYPHIIRWTEEKHTPIIWPARSVYFVLSFFGADIQ